MADFVGDDFPLSEGSGTSAPTGSFWDQHLLYLNRVYSTVAIAFVSWKTSFIDNGGSAYPGPGTFGGGNTSDYVVSIRIPAS